MVLLWREQKLPEIFAYRIDARAPPNHAEILQILRINLVANSALRRRFNIWMTCWMFRHDEYTKLCSGHVIRLRSRLSMTTSSLQNAI